MELKEADLKKLLDINEQLSHIKDIDFLLEKTLHLLRRLTRADAGSIYLVKDPRTLSIEFVQNDTLQNTPMKKLLYKKQQIPIDDFSIAGYVAKTRKMLNIEDAYRLPDIPCRFNDSFDRAAGYQTRSILTVPMLNRDRELAGVVQVINSLDPKGRTIPFDEFHSLIASIFANQAASSVERARLTHDMILRMIKLSELRDPRETGSHVKRVGAYSALLYERWALQKGIPEKKREKTRDILKIAAMLHDVGKVAVSDTILKKRVKLEKEEFDHLKSHTIFGARLFTDSHSEWDHMAREICLHHHEKWNGKGYPGTIGDLRRDEPPGSGGKKGEEIPLAARIVAIADVYDALNTERSYKPAWDEEKILRYFKEQRGKHFDPELVDIFLSLRDDLKALEQRYPDPLSDPDPG